MAFVYDIACTYFCNSVLDHVVDINNDLCVLIHYFAYHKLVLIDKTSSMLFNFPSRVAINLIGKDICTSSNQFILYLNNKTCFTFKNLFVILDWKLSWFDHTSALKSYALAVTRQIYPLK